MLNYIRNKLTEYVDIEEDAITEESHFIKDLHMNSYDFISIVGTVEDELGIEIPDNDMRELETVGDLSEYLKKKMG